MQNVTIGRFDADPDAQGVIKPDDNSWQLVIDKEGCPHLYLRVALEEGGTGMLALDDLLPDNLSVRELAGSSFGGALSPEEEREAQEELAARRAAAPIPCPH